MSEFIGGISKHGTHDQARNKLTGNGETTCNDNDVREELRNEEAMKMFGTAKLSKFDDSHIPWKTLEGIEHLAYHIYRVDEDKEIIDAVFKFDANKKIFLHKHHAQYATLVMHGELRIYYPNGELKEVRPTGSYVLTEPGAVPHTEGGGDVDAIVFFSVRGTKGPYYDVLDEDLNPIETVGFEDFKALFEAQE